MCASLTRVTELRFYIPFNIVDHFGEVSEESTALVHTTEHNDHKNRKSIKLNVSNSYSAAYMSIECTSLCYGIIYKMLSYRRETALQSAL